MKGKDVLRDLVDAGRPATNTGSAVSNRPAGAVRALNLGLGRLTEEAAAAKALRETLATAATVVEIDPTEIDSSFVNDRLPNVSDPAFDQLKQAIDTTGQQVPILVRPHPSEAGRYQAAYGHRRLRAASELKRKVKAVVRNLTDEEMVIAQGQENGPRLDLSFIERAIFALKMETHGLSRGTICAALGIDPPEVSRLVTVAETIPGDVVTAIGPAPKVGRPRWLALANALGKTEAGQRVVKATASGPFASADTNERFALVLKAALAKEPAKRANREAIKASGRRVAWLERKQGRWQLVSDQEDFVSYLDQKLPGLLADFEASVPPRGTARKEQK